MSSDDYKLFFNWLDNNGALYPKLHLIHHTPEYRSICAKQDISSSEEILIIAEKLIITYQKALEGPTNKKISSQIDCEHTHFATFVLEEKEKGKDSFWFPYINCLPKTYEDMPIFFEQDKLDIISGTLALKKIKMRNVQLKSMYDHICKLDPSFSRFSLKEFTWGRLVTITRIFGFNIKDLKTSGLVPMADMLNHKKPDRDTKKTDTHWDFDNRKMGFVITAKKGIKRDREIYDSYGFKCNTRFFVNYGFTIPNNEEDDESYISPFDIEFNVPGFYKKTREGEEKTRDMFNFLFRKVSKEEKNPITRQIKILTILKNSVEKRFTEFKYDKQKFQQLLEEEKSFSVRNCYVMCLSELTVIEKYNKLCKFLISALTTGNYRGFMDKKGKRFVATGNELIDDYVKEWILPIIKN